MTAFKKKELAEPEIKNQNGFKNSRSHYPILPHHISLPQLNPIIAL